MRARRGTLNGYIAGFDHAVYKDVEYSDFVCYYGLLREKYGKANRSTRFAREASAGGNCWNHR